MKRFLLFGLAAFLVLAFTSLAPAEKITETLSIGVDLMIDTYYYQQDKEGIARTVSGVRSAGLQKGTTTLEENRAQTFATVNKISTLYFIWNNQDKLGVTLVPNIDGEAYNIGVLYAYGFWNIIPELRFQIGKGTTLFSDLEPTITMGYDGTNNKLYGIGYGNYFSGYNTYARFEYKLGSIGYLKAGIVDARQTDGTTAASATGLNLQNNGATIDNVSTLPRFELAFPVRFGGLGIYPSGFWQQQQFDNVKVGWDKSVASYGLSLGLKGDFKPFLFMAEVNYGTNWANTRGMCYPLKSPDYTTFAAQVSSAKADSTGKIQDSTALGWWLQAGVRFGRVEPSLVIGQQTYSRTVNNLKDEMNTMMYGITCPITLAKGFTLRPEIMIYDNGSSNKISGVEYDFGKEVLVGIQFQYTF